MNDLPMMKMPPIAGQGRISLFPQQFQWRIVRSEFYKDFVKKASCER